MISDKELMFEDNVALTATRISTNVYDLGPLGTSVARADSGITVENTGYDLGAGEPLFIFIMVDQDDDFASAGASTLTITLESDSTADLATSPTVHWTSEAIAKATLVKGYTIKVPMPVGVQFEQYVGLRFTVAVADFTAGKLTAGIVKDVTLRKEYGSALSIS